jgi:hypothetical protein
MITHKQIKSVIALQKTGNATKAAINEGLYETTHLVNVGHAEKNLGAKLFYRKAGRGGGVKLLDGTNDIYEQMLVLDAEFNKMAQLVEAYKASKQQCTK